MARFFLIFHTLSFEPNFFFDRRFPLTVSKPVLPHNTEEAHLKLQMGLLYRS